MKKLLILSALAGFGAVACGGDDGDSKPTNTVDAGKGDAAVVVRPQQIDNGKVGLACTAATEKTVCTGLAGDCLEAQGTGAMAVAYPGGYCTATCQASPECGTNAGCPVAEVIDGLPPAIKALAGAAVGVLPSNCYEKCATSTDCRTDYTCASIGSLLGTQVPEQFASFLMGPAFNVTYCLPPAPATDGGVPVRDAGTTTTLGGMDAGI